MATARLSWTLVAALVCTAGCGSRSGELAAPSGDETAAQLPAPTDLAGLVHLINALPRPVSIADLVAALPHPLAINVTSSPLSLQPAVDAANPRIFIAVGHLVLSVVPVGKDANLVEVGSMGDANRMVPGQFEFPITHELTLTDAYATIMNTKGMGTICASCHGGDAAVTVAPGLTAYVTGQVLPAPSADVPVSQLSTLAAACGAPADAPRCALLKALTQPAAPTQYRF